MIPSHPQAACSDILHAGREPGEAGRVLLHARGLHWPGEAGSFPTREPPATLSELHTQPSPRGGIKHCNVYTLHLPPLSSCLSSHLPSLSLSQNLARMFVTVGMCEQAVASYIKVSLTNIVIYSSACVRATLNISAGE